MRILSYIFWIAVLIMHILFTIGRSQQPLKNKAALYCSTDGQILVYDENSEGFKKVIDIPQLIDDSYPRDFVVSNGKIACFNGTFLPDISYYNPDQAEWQNYGFPGWSTENNVSFGGIAQLGNKIFVTDMATYQGEKNGLLQFSLTKRSFNRFQAGVDFIDVTIGLDRKLYALSDNAKIYVYNPLSLKLLRIVNLPLGLELRAIAVNAIGEIFAVGYLGNIVKFDNQGCAKEFRSIPKTSFIDIDISPKDNSIVIGTYNGNLLLTNQQLEKIKVIKVGSNPVFVAFSD